MSFYVIFDMDGTLLDTQRQCIPAWDYAGEVAGIGPIGYCIPDVCGTNKAGWTAYLKRNFPTLDTDFFNKTVEDYFKTHHIVEAKKGMFELLEFLKQNGVKTAVASGGTTKLIKYNFDKLGATDLFCELVGGDMVENGKPAPDIFLLAAEKIGAKPSRCFVFEDSKNGILAAHKAGMKCIGIPDLVQFDDDTKKLLFCELSSLDEAIDIFKNLL